MRLSTITSLLIALILAGVAVYGAQNWLNQERQQFAVEMQQDRETVPTATIVVANEAIAFGARIDAARVREIPWAGDFRPDGSFEKVGDLVVGDSEETARFALTAIAPGEPILASKVTSPGQRAKLSTALTPGKKAISIRVNDVLGVAGFVLPGDRVDILLTRGGSGGRFVDVLLQGVKVLAIDQIADDRKDQPSVVRTVTFEVNTLEAQKLVLAQNIGTLSLALRNVSSNDLETNERVTINDLNDADIADDLIEAAAPPEEDPAMSRIESLEAMLKKLSDAAQKPAEPVKVEPPPEPVITPVVRPTVGVIRNGQRAEYKVDAGQQNTQTRAIGQ